MAAEKKRISEALKEEVEEAARASNLKPVETVEKNVLPSQEGWLIIHTGLLLLKISLSY